ncbi:MAG: HEAT repeat domain-containing protein [Planctomycetota bacterium]
MQKSLARAARNPCRLAIACVLLLAARSASAHGAFFPPPTPWNGPGDIGLGAGGGGGRPSTGPSTPGPSSGTQPGPGSPGPSVPGGANDSTGRGDFARSSTWSTWWELNKHPYLALKDALHATTATGGDDAFLGRGDASVAVDRLRPSPARIGGTVVPALRAALARERDNDVVTAVLIALARIGDAGGAEHVAATQALIATYLRDASQEVAETATVALGLLAEDSALELLAGLAQDDAHARKRLDRTEVPGRTRAFATYGLGLIGHRSASERTRQYVARVCSALLARADDAQPDVKAAALIALGLTTVAPVSAFRPDATADGFSSRQAQVQFAERVFRAKGGELVRAHAPAALARLSVGAPSEWRERSARALLAAVARGSNEPNGVVQGAVLALGQLGLPRTDPLDVEIVSTLSRVAEEGDVDARNFAMIALGQIGGRADSAERMRPIRLVLLSQLTRGRGHVRPWAALGVGVMEHALSARARADGGDASGVRQALREALTECADPDALGAYAIAVALSGDPAARSIVTARLEKIGDDRARGYLALSLGLMRAPDSIEPLRALLRESRYRPELLRQTAIGLGLVGDKTVVTELVTMLAEAKSQAACAAIASSLGLIGDARAVEPLVAMLGNSELTPTARSFAAVALGIVADKESLPWNAKISTDVNYRSSTATLMDGSGRGVLEIL